MQTQWELREWDDGLAFTVDWAPHYERSWADPSFARPGGESLDQLTSRAVEAVRTLASQFAGQRVLVGSHGTFVSRALRGFGAAVDWSFWRDMPMPAVYCLRFDAGNEQPAMTGPGLVGQATVRRATASDVAALAALRWRVTDGAGYRRPDHGAFVESFSGWVRDHLSTHLPFIAEVDDGVAGMAWLMVAERVPGPAQRYRRFGDVQSVYVVPELRDRGIGAALLTALLTEARKLGLEHVTVHANDRALPLYLRAGFRHHQCWLRWKPGVTAAPTRAAIRASAADRRLPGGR